jgi:flagellar hook-length control protein FliK
MMLGQLVAASVQRSNTTITSGTKMPVMILDEAVKKDDVDPEQLLAMFAMAIPQTQQLPIPVPAGGDGGVEQALQALTGSSAGGGDAALQGILQDVARQVGEAKLTGDVAVDATTVDGQQQPDSSQLVSTTPFQLQQPQTQAATHVHAASAPVHAPVGSRAWADEIGTRVVMMTESGNHTASLKLSPEHLGPLEINITVRDDKASVWFGAAHADTRAAIETALPRLREMFASQGLSLADAGVFREPPREQPVVKDNTTSAGQGEAVGEVTTVSARMRLGLVDAYA